MKGLRMDRSPKRWIAKELATYCVLACTAIASASTTPSNFDTQLQDLQLQLDTAARANKAVRLELDAEWNVDCTQNMRFSITPRRSWINHEALAAGT